MMSLMSTRYLNIFSHDYSFQAGGFVEFNRVNGNLALSRALGDFAFKTKPDLAAEKQIISPEPEVVVHEVTEDLQFVGKIQCLKFKKTIKTLQKFKARYEILFHFLKNIFGRQFLKKPGLFNFNFF